MKILCWLGIHAWLPTNPDSDIYRCRRCGRREYQPS